MSLLSHSLFRWRQERDMSMRDLAAEAGLSPAYISKLERGESNNLTVDSIMALSRALDITPSAIFAQATGAKDIHIPGQVLNALEVLNRDDWAILSPILARLISDREATP